MRYSDLSDIGGFLWWFLVKFRKTDLVEEQSKKKWERNIFILVIIFIVTVALTILITEN